MPPLRSRNSKLGSNVPNLEKMCIDTVEGGDMTRDLAILIRADHPWLTTNRFLDKLDSNLQKAMAS